MECQLQKWQFSRIFFTETYKIQQRCLWRPMHINLHVRATVTRETDHEIRPHFEQCTTFLQIRHDDYPSNEELSGDEKVRRQFENSHFVCLSGNSVTCSRIRREKLDETCSSSKRLFLLRCDWNYCLHFIFQTVSRQGEVLQQTFSHVRLWASFLLVVLIQTDRHSPRWQLRFNRKLLVCHY